MAELNDLSTTDASNTARFPEGMARASVNNAARALEGILARYYKDNNGSLATAGTSTAITVTLNSQHSAWFDGLCFAARITTTCGATPTINPTGSGALGAKSLYWAGSGVQLAAGDLTSTAVAWFMYEATSDKVYVYAAPPYALNGVLTTRGDIVTRDASNPVRLAVGAASTVLRTDGTDPSWGKVAGAHIAMGSDAQGDVLYHNGTSYARLGAGTAGQVLKTGGAAANPSWAYAGLVPILRVNGSTVADYQWTSTTAAAGFNGTFRTLKLIGWLRPATDDVELYLRISDDGGSTYEADAGDYRYNTQAQDDGGTNRGIVSTGDTQWRIGSNDATLAVGNAADERIQFELTFSTLDSSAFKKMFAIKHEYIASTGALITGQGACQVVNTAAITGIQLLFQSGDIAAGDVTLYGLPNS